MALILLAALGGGIGTLTFLAFGSVAQVILAGILTVGSAILALEKVNGNCRVSGDVSTFGLRY